MALTCGVAMCTYNGERYLGEQLASIAAQNCLPNQLVIVDDGSQDATVEIARAFAQTAPFPVSVLVNEVNLGVSRNFEKAIQRCDAEVIFLADQDDIWVAHKVEAMRRSFTEHPQTKVIFTDAELVDATLRPLGTRLWQTVGFTRAQRDRWTNGQAFQVLTKSNVVTGATMAFRRECRSLVLPIADGWIHDGWIAYAVAAMGGEIRVIEEPLILYRQHSHNQIGAQERSLTTRLAVAREKGTALYAAQLHQYRSAYERFSSWDAFAVSLSPLEEKMRHLENRLALPKPLLLRLPSVLREVRTGRYAHYSNGWASALRDLFL